jgi:hypothetical protein
VASDRVAPHRTRALIIAWLFDTSFAVALSGAGLAAGWAMWHSPPPPSPAVDEPATVSEVFTALEDVGLSCASPLAIDHLRSGVEAVCGDPHYELLVTPSAQTAGEVFHIAQSLLCRRTELADAQRWYLFTAAHWSLLTFDDAVADKVGDVAAVTVTAQDCGWQDTPLVHA